MPGWLIILLCILAALLGLLFLPLAVVCTFSTERAVSLDIRAKVLGIPIPVFALPKKKRAPNVKKFTIRALKRRGEKAKKKELAAKRKKEKKLARKAEKKQQTAEKRKAAGLPEKETVSEKITKLLHILKLVRALASILFDRFGRYLRVDIPYFDIVIAAGEPDKTAVLYGSVYAALETFWAAAAGTRPMRHVHKSDISITADFLGEKPSAKGKLSFRLRLWHLFAILIAGGRTALRFRTEQKKNETAAQRRTREAREAAARREVLNDLKH